MPIEFSQVRYIKLGKGGQWSDISLDRSEIHFGYGRVSHDLAQTLDFEAIRGAMLEWGRKPSAATGDANAVIDFYSLGRDCLWITFARGHLWWTFSDPKVYWLGGGSSGENLPEHGQRFRKCDGWSNLNHNGSPLTTQGLSTSLTKVASYQKTICRVPDSESYLRRRINGLVDPLIQQAASATDALLHALDLAIPKLHQTDFETLADVILARSGWHRVTAIGGPQTFIDLALEQPATGERAAVQVKSKANQSVLNDYIAEYDAAGTFSRLFFVCHTSNATLTAPGRNDVHIWQGQALSKQVLRLGLTDWVFEKIA